MSQSSVWILISLGILICVVDVLYYEKSVRPTLTVGLGLDDRNNGTHIIIGIMSAQGNFDARQSIRDSWKTLTYNRNISLYFLVGDTFCDIPPLDRISSDSCRELERPGPPIQTKELSTHIIGLSTTLKPTCTGFTFITHHKLVVNRFSVLNSIVDKFNPVQVHLIDLATQEKIVTVSFRWHRLIDDSKSTVLSKAIEPVILPQNFEGQILIETLKPLLSSYKCPLHWNNNTGVLSFLHTVSPKQQLPVTFSVHSCSPVSMMYDIHDAEELESLLQSRAQRQVLWNENTTQIGERLLKESNEQKDIIFLHVTDVYRNLPKKLALFFKWLYSEKKFTFVIKTDDDTFINIVQVERELSRVEIPQQSAESPYLWWWSTFREHWAVGFSGKWREDVYRSLTYPPFPCGAGYVLSYDVVRYLAINSAFLQTDFQGEDTALGVWLAGLRTIKHSTEHLVWSCDETCLANGCNKAQLSVSGMYETWEFYKKCGDMCNCAL